MVRGERNNHAPSPPEKRCQLAVFFCDATCHLISLFPLSLVPTMVPTFYFDMLHSEEVNQRNHFRVSEFPPNIKTTFWQPLDVASRNTMHKLIVINS